MAMSKGPVNTWPHLIEHIWRNVVGLILVSGGAVLICAGHTILGAILTIAGFLCL